MSRFLVVLFFSGVTAAGALAGAAGTAQAQAYIDGGVGEVYVGDAVRSTSATAGTLRPCCR